MSNELCAVGRVITRQQVDTPPCPQYGLHRIEYEDGGDGRPLVIDVCEEHLPQLVSKRSLENAEPMHRSDQCMAGRNLYGAPGFDEPCPEAPTVVMQTNKIVEGRVIDLHLCLRHRFLIPEDLL